MRWIVGSSLKFRYIVIFIAAALVFFGTTQLRDMPVDVFPEFAPPRVEIQTPALGLSAAEVESLVTIPLEEQLTGVPGVDVMRSKSVEQLSSVLLIFEPGTDLMLARQLVQERLQMYQVQVEPARLRENGVSLEQIMTTTSDALDAGLMQFSEGAVIGTGGFIDTPNQRLQVQHVLPIITPENLAQVSFQNNEGRILRLGEVAEVVEGHQPLIGDAVIDDGPGLLLIVEKLPWANTLEVTRGVDEALRALEAGLDGGEIDATIFRPANFIETAIDKLTRSLIIASLLVILVLGLFLFDWRTALISVVAIPLSLISAALVLYFLGVSMNTMVLAGFVIALGDVVDDAIIDVENIVRRLRQYRREGTNKSTATIILEASLEVRNAIVFATLIIVVALSPILFMEGLSGAFFKPLALSYVLAMLASMVVALTVTPALSLILLRKAPLERRDPPVMRWLVRGYNALLSRIVSAPRAAYLTVVATAVAGIVVFPLLGQD